MSVRAGGCTNKEVVGISGSWIKFGSPGALTVTIFNEFIARLVGALFIKSFRNSASPSLKILAFAHQGFSVRHAAADRWVHTLTPATAECLAFPASDSSQLQ
jgi:hypothetical protein